MKVIQADDAVRRIPDGATVIFAGSGAGHAVPQKMIDVLAEVYQAEGHPRDLTTVRVVGLGDFADRGFSQLALPGLMKRTIGSNIGNEPRLGALVEANEIEAYSFPQGVLSLLCREIAGGRPGLVTHVGLNTYVDPRQTGGKQNARTTEDLVEVVTLRGQEWLLYHSFPIDVAVIRGSSADEDGNLTMEEEAVKGEMLAMAMAARNSGGIVIAQVERIAESGSLPPRQVNIPGTLVDAVVVAERAAYHQQTFAVDYDPAYSAELRVPAASVEPMPPGPRKTIARRAAQELRPNDVVNLGIGMPEGVAAVAAEEKIIDLITLTTEPGTIGGIPAGGLSFGAAVNAQAVIDQPYQFDFYDGGGLDIAVLGMAQVDAVGNINVSRFGPRLAGAGGFINISQNARRLVFVGSFLAGRGDSAVRKFVREVEHRTFSAHEALRRGQPVLYVTERCVFGLHPSGLELLEIAPGLDLERDILAHMDFRPVIGDDVATMSPALFAEAPLGLRERLLERPLAQRFSLDADADVLYIDFEHLHIRSRADIDAVEREVGALVAPLGRRVHAIVNYDHFRLPDELEDAWVDMVRPLVERHYTRVTRYSATGFLRARLDGTAAGGTAA